jgi:hypothetical protein
MLDFAVLKQCIIFPVVMCDNLSRQCQSSYVCKPHTNRIYIYIIDIICGRTFDWWGDL